MSRILIVAGHPDSLINFRGLLIKALQVAGLKVCVVAPDLPSDSPIRLQLEGMGVGVYEIPLVRARTNPLVDLCSFWELLCVIRSVSPSIILCYTIKPVIYGLLASWLQGVPNRFALITGVGYALIGDSRRSRFLARRVSQFLYRLSLRHARKVFFQNSDDEDFFRKLGLLRPSIPSVVVNGSGVDLTHFSVVRVLAGPSHFLLIARLLGDKGVREYVQAAQRIKAMHPEVQFSLAGWLDENPDSIRQSELDSWIESGAVRYLGRLQDVRPSIAECSVYVLPSYREGTPRTVLEAMAMGRAIVTTDAPGCRETVIDGDNGLLVPVQSVDSLVMAMLRFVYDPGLAVRMGQRSRQIAEEKYDVHKVNAVMLREMGLGR